MLAGLLAAVLFVGILMVLRLQTPGAAPALAGQILIGMVAVALLVGAVLFYRAWYRQNPPPVRPPPRGFEDDEQAGASGPGPTGSHKHDPDRDARHPE